MPAKNGTKTEERTTENADDLQKVTERVTKLVALAQQENENEARTAAITAVNLMAKHELCVITKAELEQVKTIMDRATKMAKRAKSEKTKNMVVGALLGHVLLGKGGLRL